MAAKFLAIDLGTSSVKVLLVDEDGAISGQGSAEYPTYRPRPDYAEQVPADWWHATVSATRQAIANVDGGDSISAIGLSGQMHGTVLLDEGGAALAPAIIWADGRSRRQVQAITDLIGRSRLIELTGSPVATGFQAATIRWVQEERPDIWNRVATILLPKDCLRWRLTGAFATDPSDGSGTLLLDVRKRDWSPEILSALEIDPRLMPPVRESSEVTGHLHSKAAAELGLATGIPVVAGGGDAPCAMLGAGIVQSDTLLLTISTGAQVMVPSEGVQVDQMGRMHTFCGPLAPGPNQAGWYQMGATLTAGLGLSWLRDQVFDLHGDDAYSRMTAWAKHAPPGSNGLLFLPYLIGERTPYMDSTARGMFLGLTAAHGRAELVRAVMEGATLACYDAYQVLAETGAAPERIVLAGGGARSTLWRRIVADIFNFPVYPLATADQSAVGAALLAAAATDHDPVTIARAWASYEAPVSPHTDAHECYVELYAMFRAAYEKHRDDFVALSGFGQAADPTSH